MNDERKWSLRNGNLESVPVVDQRTPFCVSEKYQSCTCVSGRHSPRNSMIAFRSYLWYALAALLSLVDGDCDLHELCLDVERRTTLEAAICEMQSDCMTPREIDCSLDVDISIRHNCLATDVRINFKHAFYPRDGLTRLYIPPPLRSGSVWKCRHFS